MFLALLTLGLLVSCSADISHLGLSPGYQYEIPHYNVNIPIHIPQKEQQYHPVEVLQVQQQQQYLPPIQQNYAPNVPLAVEYYKPQVTIPLGETVHQEYLPPNIVTEPMQAHQPNLQIVQYVKQPEHAAPLLTPNFETREEEIQLQYQTQGQTSIYETHEPQGVSIEHSQQAFDDRTSTVYASPSQTGGYHYDTPKRRFRLK